jgi:hypothetical protein
MVFAPAAPVAGAALAAADPVGLAETEAAGLVEAAVLAAGAALEGLAAALLATGAAPPPQATRITPALATTAISPKGRSGLIPDFASGRF